MEKIRVVIKIGTSSIISDDGKIKRKFLSNLAHELSEHTNVSPIIVSSGAIGLGLERLKIKKRPSDMPTLQAAAAIGQVDLINAYKDVFADYEMLVAQLLITRATTADRSGYLHARDTINRLLSLNIIPVINENDTVAVEEIKFGDNDTLAALVATSINADYVIILSDVDGLYSADPNTFKDAKLLKRVKKLTKEIEKSAGGAGSVRGSGGMITKLSCARVLLAANIPMLLCNGANIQNLRDALNGQAVGTAFFDDASSGLTAKKSWIALGAKVKGKVVCDDGAVVALQKKGSSLLPVGILSSSGSFKEGEPVDVYDKYERLIARGIASYSSKILEDNIGLREAQEFIHRDNLVVF
ncbi:MAG: glutamate 5-kinase [Coriobacteriales bacterium]|nr:glutamate 5-kinase [Coriobacteriales bacterium]